MQQRVVDESSHFALRQHSREGAPLFEAFTLDEGYETRFRSYFYAAQGELTAYMSAYLMLPSPETIELVETGEASDAPDISEEDWIIRLRMPRAFDGRLAKPAGFKIEDFVENFIMYRWLETKAPEAAAVYGATADKLKTEINADLNKRLGGIVRPGCYW
jgi:hypothetical protein